MAASKAGIVAGKAFVILEALDGTGAVLRAVESRFMATAMRLQNVSRMMFTRALTAAVPGALSTRIFTQYDDTMRRVEARTSGTAEEMQALKDQARELGRTSAFSAREVANLMDVLAQRKFDRSQIRAMSEPILKLGRAGGGSPSGQGADLLNAADLVSQALMMYQLPVSEAARVADVFTVAANESNFALEDLIIGMANAGPVANQFNASLEETLAILMIMRDLSIDPSVAGTGLRNIYLKASDKKAVDEFNELMKEATGSMIEFESEGGDLKPPSAILKAFDELTSELGTAARGHLLAELFGLRAITPATAASANISGFTDNLDKLRAASGETEKAYQLMESGIGGVLRRLKNGAEELAIAIGEALAPGVAGLASIINRLTLGLSEWAAQNEDIVLAINAGIVALFPLAAALFLAGTALKIFAILSSPVIKLVSVLISAFRMLSLGLISLSRITYTVTSFMIKSFVTMTVSISKAIFSGLVKVFTVAIYIITNLVGTLVAVLFYVVPAIVTLLAKSFIYLIGNINKMIKAFDKAFQSAMKLFIRAFKNAAIPVVKMLMTSIVKLTGMSIRLAEAIGGAILKIISLFAARVFIFGFVTAVSVGFSLLSTAITGMISLMGGFIVALGGALLPALGGIVVWIAQVVMSVVRTVVSGVYSLVSAVVTAISSKLSGVFGAVQDGFYAFMSGASNGLDTLIAGVKTYGLIVAGIMDGIMKAMMAGDMALAKDIGLAAAKVAWLRFFDFIMDNWMGLKSAVANIMQELEKKILEFVVETESGRLMYRMFKWLALGEAPLDEANKAQEHAMVERLNELRNPVTANETPEERNARFASEARGFYRSRAIERAQQTLDALLAQAAASPDLLAQMQADLDNLKTEAHALPKSEIENLIKDGSPTGFGGAKAMDALDSNSIDAYKAIWEDRENSLLKVAQKQLETEIDMKEVLDNMERGIDRIASAPQVKIGRV